MKKTCLHKYLIYMLLLPWAGMLQAQQVTDTFRYSGQIVHWTVPQGVTSITIQARGAGGGYLSPHTIAPGLGASMQGTFTVVPGKILKILTGQNTNGNNSSSGGGGGSFVTDTLNNPLIIAGGGGGSGNVDSSSKHGQAGTAGGFGTFSGGQGGTNGQGGGCGFLNGGGGGLLTDGIYCGSTVNGRAFLNGGNGGTNTENLNPGGFGGGGAGFSNSGFGGGGGGGYSGGGGSGGAPITYELRFGVGGGGSSINNGFNKKDSTGVNSGNGLVTITYSISSFTCGRDTTVYSAANQCGAVVNYTAPAPPQRFTTISDTFHFTGTRQTFSVPVGISSVIIKTWGAKGGGNSYCVNSNSSGLGGYAQGRLIVTASNILHIYVGGQPTTQLNSGGYNGGGRAGYSGGGGASDVRMGDSALTSRIIVAGGGGGIGNSTSNNCALGGMGGGLQGGNGEDDGGYLGGGGGTQNEGGNIGSLGFSGTLGQGADGIPFKFSSAASGGGGGYYGGGSTIFSGGGGGSGYIGGVMDGSTQAGVNSGNGLVVISYEVPVIYTITQTTGLPSGSSFPVGSTVNTYVLSQGNTPLDTCSFIVTVRDTIKPNITAPAAIMVNTDAGKCSASNVALGTPVTSDNCSTVTLTNNAPAVFPKGITTITYTARDSSGNTATATQTVTVSDNEKPVIACPAAQQFCYNSISSYIIPVLSTTDNCGIQTTGYVVSGATQRSGNGNNASGVFGTGTSTITWTVKDAANNVSTCTTNVVINPLPAAPIIANVTAYQGTATVVLKAANCSGTLVWINPDNTTGSGSQINVSTATTGSYIYKVACQGTMCTSPYTTVTVTILSTLISVSHLDGDNNNPVNNIIKPYLRLNNESNTAVPYKDLSVRYWLTAENYAPFTNLSVYWAQLGTSSVSMKYVKTSARQGAFGYVEYTFSAAAGNLPGNNNSGPIQSGVGKQDWTPFNEADDYSFAPNTAYTKTGKITVYRNGSLIWGTEPAPVAPVIILATHAQNQNNSTNSNTISHYLKVNNEGNQPVAYKDITVRYWFTKDGNSPLKYNLDYALLGSNNVTGSFVTLPAPLTKADTYLQLSFPNLPDSLYPISSTGNIQQRINKQDWSAFTETNDHSFKISGPMALNATITIYIKGQLVFGNEPAAQSIAKASDATFAIAGSASTTIPVEVAEPFNVKVLQNPLEGNELRFVITGAKGQSLNMQLVDVAGRLITQREIKNAGATEFQRLRVADNTSQMIYLRVSMGNTFKVIKVMKANRQH